MRVGWLAAGYAGLTGFFALEASARERCRGSSLEASADDSGTTRGLIVAYVVSAAAAPVLGRLPLGRLPWIAGPVGVGLQIGGIALRRASMLALGRSYTRTLRTADQQAVVDVGPYASIRHPGYLGSLLTWAGFALTSRSLPAIALVGSLIGHAYKRRIDAEERLLLRQLPGYEAYRRRTSRLIPGLW